MDKILLEKFIKGDCTAEEAATVLQWLQEDPTLLDDYMDKVWEEPISHTMPASMEAALQQELNDMTGAAQKRKNVFRINRRMLLSAAAIFILFIAGWWVYQNLPGSKQAAGYNADEILVEAPAGKPYRLVLPDQSIAWLQENTRLRYDAQAYSGETRQVQLLEGEAFFEVQKDPTHPFIVNSGKVQTRVLGTSFSVRAAGQDTTVTVTVATGKVEVSHGNKVLDVLLPGRQINVDPASGTFTGKEVPLWLAAAWKEEEIQLTRAGFEELVTAMKLMYGVSLETKSRKVQAHQYNITLSRNTAPEEIIKVLGLLNRQQYQKKNDSTFLLY